MEHKWWHDKVAYQIYPRSFYDANGDGTGDIRGIIEKLDYLQELGIDIVWISPIYQSPFVDQGYDISDYYRIDPLFGTMEDFDELLVEARKRNIEIIMDLVINHCSEEHEWFQKALKDPYGEYGEYFYFCKGKGENPPNNFRSYFGGSAWEKVEGTDLYYLHMFAKAQPDLNWNNPKVLEELYKMVNWWLDKGLAGFRIDAIINIKKDLAFPDYEPDGPDGLASCWQMCEKVEGVGEMLEDLKKHTFEPHDAFTVAEVFNMKKEELVEFVGAGGHFSTMFDFSMDVMASEEMGLKKGQTFVPLRKLKEVVFHSQKECMGIGFLANILENHDEARSVDRFLPEYARTEAGVKMLGTVSILLRGLPFIYQGQEIGMRNCRFEAIEDYEDISTHGTYELALKGGVSEAEALEYCYRTSRDNARTPMQWDDSLHAGFTKGIPWFYVNQNYKTLNVKAQQENPESVLNYYKKLIALRKKEEYREVFTYGDFKPLLEESDTILAYERSLGDLRIRVYANFGKESERIDIPVGKNVEEPISDGQILLTNLETEITTNGQLNLKSTQVVVLRV